MAALPTIGVHDNFPSGQPAVSHGAAYDKPACGIDKKSGIAIHHFFGNNFSDHFLDNGIFEVFIGHVIVMLGGDHHSIHPLGLAVFIFNGHLGFAVRPQKSNAPFFLTWVSRLVSL